MQVLIFTNDKDLGDYVPSQGWTEKYKNSHSTLDYVCHHTKRKEIEKKKGTGRAHAFVFESNPLCGRYMLE